MHRLFSLASLALLAVAAFADEKAPPQFKTLLPAIDLNEGDTLVFLGDSITHQCLYTQYVEDYFYTRFPKVRLHFHNAGVGGDRAKDALTRFDEDVAPYKPKYVTMLLGMNDGAYKDFDKAVFDTYQADMSTLLDKIAALGAVAVPMTPTMHDARSARVSLRGPQEPRDTYYNGVLALYGGWLREQAQVRGLGFVDMWSPLNNLTLAKRKTDADWTMIKDAVHPGPVGQVVMAAAIVSDMVKRRIVSQITVDAILGGPVAKGNNATIDHAACADGKLTFTALEAALPWVLPEDSKEGQQLARLGHHFSNEKITVRQLPAGKYSFKIDGQEIGKYTEAQLSMGVEIEDNEKAPQHRQALQVAVLNQQRNAEAYHPLRDQYALLKGKRRDLQKSLDAQEPQAEAKKAAFTEWYAGAKARIAELLAKARGFEDQIYLANQPAPHSFEIALIQPPTK